jgi:hypothetical protein
MRRNLKGILAFGLGWAMLLGAGITTSAEEYKEAWQIDIDWAASNTGAPDCPWLYAPIPDWLATGVFNLGGNRACAIAHAIDQARNNQDLAAFGLVLITQCHNATEQQNLTNAGPYAVGNYLRRF